MGKIYKAVGYCRFSSDKQREESIEAQQDAILRFARAENYEIVKWYIDRACSAKTDDRPQFQKMITDSDKKDFQFVIVHKQDRFARNKYDAEEYKKQLRDNKVRVLSATEPNLSGYAGVMLESILEANAMGYSVNLANEVRKGMRMNAKKAQVNNKPPYGYKLVARKDKDGEVVTSPTGRVVNDIAIDPLQAEAVKIMFNMTLAGAKIESIVNELNSKGYRNSQGGKFVTNSLGHYLRNERYTGVYIFDPSKKYRKEECIDEEDLPEDSEYRSVRVEGGMPQIISREVFDAVQVILNGRKHKPSHHSKVDYLLTGKITCGECGGKFTGSTHFKNGQPYYYYRCGRSNADCKVISVRKEPLENFVINEIENVVHSEDVIAEILDNFVAFYKEKNSNSELIQHLKKAEREIERKIDNLVNTIAESGKFGERLQSKLSSLEDEKTEILAKLKQESEVNLSEFITKSDLRRTYFNVLNLLKTGNTEDKAAIIDTILNRVIVYKDRLEIFINLLPVANTDINLHITDKDLATYGLLEPHNSEKAVHMNDFPSEKMSGDPAGNRTRDCAVRGRRLNRLTTRPFLKQR